MDYFKEDIHKYIGELELRYKHAYNDMKLRFDEKMEQFNKDYENFGLKMADIQSANVTERIKLDKIDGLEKFKESADEIFFSLNNGVKKLQSEITTACNKYDKIFLENLEIPGLIGDFCKFKNLRYYIEV